MVYLTTARFACMRVALRDVIKRRYPLLDDSPAAGVGSIEIPLFFKRDIEAELTIQVTICPHVGQFAQVRTDRIRVPKFPMYQQVEPDPTCESYVRFSMSSSVEAVLLL